MGEAVRNELTISAEWERLDPTLRRQRLNTREKRLEFSRNGTDKRMTRLVRALSEGAPPNQTDRGGGA